jgi:hypothetical protein
MRRTTRRPCSSTCRPWSGSRRTSSSKRTHTLAKPSKTRQEAVSCLLWAGHCLILAAGAEHVACLWPQMREYIQRAEDIKGMLDGRVAAPDSDSNGAQATTSRPKPAGGGGGGGGGREVSCHCLGLPVECLG